MRPSEVHANPAGCAFNLSASGYFRHPDGFGGLVEVPVFGGVHIAALEVIWLRAAILASCAGRVRWTPRAALRVSGAVTATVPQQRRRRVSRAFDKGCTVTPILMRESEGKIQRKMSRKSSISRTRVRTRSALARKMVVNDTHEATSQRGDSEGGGNSATGDKQVQTWGRSEMIYYGDRPGLIPNSCLFRRDDVALPLSLHPHHLCHSHAAIDAP